MNFLEKLDFLLKQNHLTRKQFAEQSGLRLGTIENWYYRGYDGMTVSTLRQVCSYFGVSMESMAYDNQEITYVKRIEESA